MSSDQEMAAARGGPEALEAPLALLAEVTHRCPLMCPYCSNPLELVRASEELSTQEWCSVLEQAAGLGVLQVHFSGGEPTARRDLEQLVRHARDCGLYSNLITAGVLLDRPSLARLAATGLDHVQISIQDSLPDSADLIAGLKRAYEKKVTAARAVREAGLPLTLNAPIHRHNVEHLPALIELALALGAERLEVAHVQYYGWALKNRAALIPTAAQLETATRTVEAARARLAGRLAFDYVVPDYYAHRPKACMGGWGRRFLNVTPSGRVLPCHAAETIPGLVFDSVRERPLADIWQDSLAFRRFRGTAWMQEPCRSCERREIDWGGCRCQALALAGDAAATDPACALSPRHRDLVALAERESQAPAAPFLYRRFHAAQGKDGRRPAQREKGIVEGTGERDELGRT